MDRIETINGSLRCFVFGLLSLVPLLGIPLGVLALLHFRRVAVENGSGWNPARIYLWWGFVLGGMGLLASLLLFGFLQLEIATGAFSS